MKLITEEQAAIAYEEATDGCRRSVLGTREYAGQWQRVKPDEETNPLAGFDCEKEPTTGRLSVTTPELLRHTDSIEIQSPVLYGPPNGRNHAAAKSSFRRSTSAPRFPIFRR